MGLKNVEFVVWLLFFGTVALMYSLTHVVRFFIEITASSLWEDSWIIRLSFNLIGYASICIPGYFIFRYVKNTTYLESSESSYLLYVIRLCANGSDPVIGADNTPPCSYQRSALQEAGLMMICFCGLQLTYLTWGLMQEKVMTQEYVNSSGISSHYKDSQFLVFVNRILAFALSGMYITLTHQPRHTAPLHKYVYCSFSNIMSSWCQYEALKYVSFPTQVLAKASKIIPVMIMGKIVSKKKYEYYEYLTAGLISVGMVFFLSGNTDDHKGNTITTFSGVILLGAYMGFDSFTSSWQGALFSKHNMSTVQMMCGVNLFSCLFTAVSIAQQNGFAQSFLFMSQYPKFITDCLVLSLCSAAGQFFIFFTISQFGPVVFVIIMTIRQVPTCFARNYGECLKRRDPRHSYRPNMETLGLAILLSCIMYDHPVSALGVLGIIIVFVAIFLRIYCNHRIRSIRKRSQVVSNIKG